MDSHCKELELNVELTMYMNDDEAIKAMKEAEEGYTSKIEEAESHH